MTRIAAAESGKLGYGVRVNCVYPGLVPTAMGMGLAVDMAVAIGPVPERRGVRRRRRRADAVRTPRRGGRHGRRRRLPGLRRRPLRHRHRPAGRRAGWGSSTMSTKPVVVYGASGYTGRLICEYLREFNVPFVAAGREQGPAAGRRRQDPRHRDRRPRGRRGRAHRRGADRAVRRRAGRLQHRRPVHQVRPRGRRGLRSPPACHYLDTTGEQDWVMAAQEQFGDDVRRQGPAALARASRRCTRPARSRRTSRWRRPGLDTLDILVLWKGFPTYASTQTIFTILKADWFYLQQNQYVSGRPAGDVRRRRARPARARRSPCRGAAPATRCGSRTTRAWPTCKVAGGVMDRTVMEGVVATTAAVEEHIKTLPPRPVGRRPGQGRRPVGRRACRPGRTRG